MLLYLLRKLCSYQIPALLVSIGLLGLVTAQSGWVLRPFIARPTAEVTLFRPMEADILSSLATSAASATGSYGEWEDESSGFVGRGIQREER